MVIRIGFSDYRSLTILLHPYYMSYRIQTCPTVWALVHYTSKPRNSHTSADNPNNPYDIDFTDYGRIYEHDYLDNLAYSPTIPIYSLFTYVSWSCMCKQRSYAWVNLFVWTCVYVFMWFCDLYFCVHVCMCAQFFLQLFVYVCWFVCMCVYLVAWFCGCAWLCMLTSPVLLELAHDTRYRNAVGASGVMCRVLSLVSGYYFKNDPQ